MFIFLINILSWELYNVSFDKLLIKTISQKVFSLYPNIITGITKNHSIGLIKPTMFRVGLKIKPGVWVIDVLLCLI